MSRRHEIFCKSYILPVAVAQFSDDNAVRYVLPVLWMTSPCHIMHQIQIQASSLRRSELFTVTRHAGGAAKFPTRGRSQLSSVALYIAVMTVIQGKGDSFGDQTYQESTIGQSMASVRALTYCDLHVIRRGQSYCDVIRRGQLREVLDFYQSFAAFFVNSFSLTYNLRRRVSISEPFTISDPLPRSLQEALAPWCNGLGVGLAINGSRVRIPVSPRLRDSGMVISLPVSG